MADETLTIPAALSDPNYQLQQTQLARQLADFKAQQGLEQEQYKGNYNQQTRRLGRGPNGWDPTIPNGQYGLATRANENDFAGRGMTYSGANLAARGNIDADFNDQQLQLDRGALDYGNTQAQALRNLESQQEAVRQQAQAAAVATIAARYGIDLDQVGLSDTKSVTREAL